MNIQVEDRFHLRSKIHVQNRIRPLSRPYGNITPSFPVTDTLQPPLIDSPSPLHAAQWRSLLEPHQGDLSTIIFNIITYGAQLGYTGPKILYNCKNLTSTADAPEVITDQLHADLARGRVSPAAFKFPFYSSPVGLVPKSDGGWRRIHHLSHPAGNSINDWISPDSSRLAYTSRTDFINLVLLAGRGSLLIKRDLKDAFRMVPVAMNQRWMLGFQWEGQYYHENCLPFGLRTAPFIFNLLGEGLHWILCYRLHWLIMAHYLDDFISVIPAGNSRQAVIYRNTWDATTEALGLVQNRSKNAEGTCVECLGIEIDTIAMEARLPRRKLAKAARLVSNALTAGTLTRHECEKLTGFLSFCTVVVRLGRTFVRPLWHFQTSFHRPGAARPLTHNATAALQWWRDLLPVFNGVRLIVDTSRRCFHLFSDASDLGQGAFFYEGDISQGDWRAALPVPQAHAFSAPWAPSQQEQIRKRSLSINTRELIAIATAITAWAPIWAGGTLVIHTDNETARTGFTKEDVRDPEAMTVLRDALLAAAAHDIHTIAVRVTSADNGLADLLSRLEHIAVANLCPHWQDPLPYIPQATSSRGMATSMAI